MRRLSSAWLLCNEGLNRMNMMIQDLVDTARLEGGQFSLDLQPVELGKYFAEVIARSISASEISRIKLDIPPDLPLISADS